MATRKVRLRPGPGVRKPKLPPVEVSGAQAAAAAVGELAAMTYAPGGPLTKAQALEATASAARAVVGGAIASAFDAMLPSRGGDNRTMLTAQGYKDSAAAILAPLATVCAPGEVGAIVGMRLRAAAERFVERGGANWAELLGLMCAYQQHANDLREQPAKPKGGA